MVAALFDTCILIDHLNGIEAARDEFRRFGTKRISIISWMEVLVGVPAAFEDRTRDFLRQFEILHIDAAVAERAVRIRRERRIKLPDALIWATAEMHGSILVSRNTKDFPADDPGIHMPYMLG